MNFLVFITLAFVATFVRADMPTAEEVALAKQTRICIDMGNDMKTCLDKLGDKLDKFDIVHFMATVNNEAVLKELGKFLEVWQNGKYTIRETLAIMKQQQRQKREMPTQDEIQLANQFKICLDMGNNKDSCLTKFADKIAKYDKTHFMSVVNYNAVLKQLGEFFAIWNNGEKSIKEAIEILNKRQRRGASDVAWYPSAEEVAMAKQIKICLDMGKDKDQCYEKCLGANKEKFDLVRLDTITKYEDVLRELKQFQAIYNQGGHTIRETLLILHKQQTGNKNRAITAQNVQDLVDLKTTVLECMNAIPQTDVTKCAVAIFGPQIKDNQHLAMVHQLVNHPAVQEFAKGAGQKLHEYMKSCTGVIAKVHDLAHAAFEAIYAYFG